MNPFYSFGVSTILFVLTLFFLSPTPTFSEHPDPIQEKEKLPNALSLARKEFVTHINTASKTGDLSRIHYHTQESLRFGKDLLSHAKAILNVIEEVVRSLNPRDEEKVLRLQIPKISMIVQERGMGFCRNRLNTNKPGHEDDNPPPKAKCHF